MSVAGAAETWGQWTSRIAGELTGLTEGEWLTITAAPDGSAGRSPGASDASTVPPPYAAGAPVRERRWSRRRGASRASDGAREPVSDVFLQARLLEGVLALECISDTQFEGLSDLTAEQEQALVALGWEQQGTGPAFERTYALSDDHPAADTATEAADLLRQSLERVLGALSPDDVVLRRPAGGSAPG
jgi:hypothetical protein